MKNKPQKIILALAIIATGVLGVLAYHNRQLLMDWFSGLSYSATPELATIENSVSLTNSGKLILHASHPLLASRDDFNAHCDSHDEQISVLGCYTGGKIYVYNIDEADLAGIKESTIAHELLHAVWARLSNSEKSDLSTELIKVYNDEKYHTRLSEDLETYDNAEQIDELHSRIGTEIADLPDALEAHYAKYFENQDLVVDYYDSYITPFRELSEEIERLSIKLEDLSKKIEELTSLYYATAEKLSADIDEFNKCAHTVGCYATDALFYNVRNKLVARKDAIEDDYENLNKLINEYNALVKEYNENVVRGETLENMINSNAKVEDIK